jgi:hypothetical protein
MIDKRNVVRELTKIGEHYRKDGSFVDFAIESGGDEITASYLVNHGQNLVIRLQVNQELSTVGTMHTAVTLLDYKKMSGLNGNHGEDAFLNLDNGSGFEFYSISCDYGVVRGFLEKQFPELARQPRQEAAERRYARISQ